MKKLPLALLAWLSLCCAVHAQVPGGGSPMVPTAAPGAGISGTFTAGDLIVGGPGSTQVQDSGIALANVALSGYYGAMNINGDMAIDQLHEGAAYVNTNCAVNATNGPPLDGWRCGYSSFWGSTTQQLSNDAPAGYKYSLKLTGGAGVSIISTQEEDIRSGVDGSNLQGLGWGAVGASSVLFDFCAKASQTGTYAAFIQNNGKSETYLQPYTIVSANTWQCYSNVVAGPTSATWSTATGSANIFYIGFDMGSGSNFQGTAGWNAGNTITISGNVEVRATTSATLQIAAVHLRPLTVSGVPYQPRPLAQELQLAQRFVRKSFPLGTAPAQSAGLAGARCVTNPVASGRPSIYQQFDVPMEGTPTIATYNPSAANANWRDVTASADVTVTVDASTAKGQTGFEISTGAAVTTIADDLCIHYIAVAP